MSWTSQRLAAAARLNPRALAIDLQPDQLIRGLTAGVLAGVLGVIWSTSYATLIFSGPLSTYLGRGLALALAGVVILNLVAAFGSAFPIAEPQDKFALIVAAMAASIAGTLGSGSDHLLPTVLALIALTSLSTGAFFLLLGVFRLGRMVRYVPFPVIGGFLAGTGWLIAVGAIQVLTGVSPTLTNLNVFASGAPAAHALMGVGAGVVLLVALQRLNHFLVMPALLVAFAGLFFVGLAATGTSIHQAGTENLLLGPLPGGSSYQLPSPSDWPLVDWEVLFAQAGGIASVMLISAVGLLLNVASLEAASGDDLDLNRELRSMGVGNLITGAAGGFAGFESLGSALVAQRIGSWGKVVGIASAAVAVLVLLAGTSLLGYIPRFLVGGLLFYLGVSLLVEWVYRTWFSMPRLEYATVIVILVVIARWGFLPGLMVGIGLGIIIFVVTYSRVGAVKHELTGATFRSNVERADRQREILRQEGDCLEILELHGFLFFGTANSLLEWIRHRLADATRPRLRFVVLDWHLVIGVDASVSLAFGRLRQLAGRNGVSVILTGLGPSVRRSLEGSEAVRANDPVFRLFPDLDRGVEWCENQILDSLGDAGSYTASLQDRLAELAGSDDVAGRILSYFDRLEFAKGECVVRQGAPPDAMYLIDSGKLSVDMEEPDGTTVRVRTVFGSTMVGEMGFYLGTARTASVVAIEPSVLYRVDRERLDEMGRRDPGAALSFGELITRVLAQRVIDADATVESLFS